MDSSYVNGGIGTMKSQELVGRVRVILEDDAPGLREIAARVEPGDPALRQEIADVGATLADYRRQTGFGRAMAAPQVGIGKRFIVMNLGAGVVALVNPEVSWRSAERQVVWDDCLSVPGSLVRVERSASISVRYEDEFGKRWHWERLPAELAELLEHELDHLDGVLMTDRALEVAPLERRAELLGAQRGGARIRVPEILRARSVIDRVFLNSPQFECEPLSALLGCRVILKVETMNPIRSFKGRGADYFVERYARECPGAPLLAASAGNWGQALGYSCRRWGVKLIVFAAVAANPLKVERMRALGADVRLSGHDFDAAKEEAKRFAAETGWYMVEDGLEPDVTVGHGTMAMELTEQWRLDAMVVPLGNGAMLNGVGRWMKAASPGTKVIGVCAAGAPAMRDSWLAGPGAAMVRYSSVATSADGIGVREPIPEAVGDMFGVVDDVVLVSEEEIGEAMRLAHRHVGLVLEPSGAAGLAAVRNGRAGFAGQTVGCVLCGGNLAEKLVE